MAGAKQVDFYCYYILIVKCKEAPVARGSCKSADADPNLSGDAVTDGVQEASGGSPHPLLSPKSPRGAVLGQVSGGGCGPADPAPPCPPPAHRTGCRPRQVVASSAHPLVVVSTTQEDDCDESSSFLMERLLQVLPLSGADFTSAGRRGVSVGAHGSPPGTDAGQLHLQSQDGPRTWPASQPCWSQLAQPAPGSGRPGPHSGSVCVAAVKGAGFRSGAASSNTARRWKMMATSEAAEGAVRWGREWQRLGRGTSACPSTCLTQRGQIF